MTRPKRIALAALSALALLAVATSSTAQISSPPTEQERAARGLDMVRYCAPQIAALGRRMSLDPGRVASNLKLKLDFAGSPVSAAVLFAKTLDRLNAGLDKIEPVALAEIELNLCLYGREMALNADGVTALGWITIKNDSAADASFWPLHPTGNCKARKNGGLCTLPVQAGTYKIRTDFGGGIDVGEVAVAPGQQSVMAFGGR